MAMNDEQATALGSTMYVFLACRRDSEQCFDQTNIIVVAGKHLDTHTAAPPRRDFLNHGLLGVALVPRGTGIPAIYDVSDEI